MNPSDTALRALWARASTLDERLSGAFVPVAGGEAEADARLQAWRVLAAEGDPVRLARRFAFDGLDEARVRALLGAVAVRPGVALPPEFDLLREALAPLEPAPADPILDDVLSRLPFAEVLAPLLRAAQRRLDEQLKQDDCASTAPALRLGCARGLADSLCEQAGPTLAALLDAERALRADGCYQRLVRRTTGCAGAAFWHQHAALARGLAIAAWHWLAASRELLLRLRADAVALTAAFGPRAAAAPVELQTGFGDPHRGGRGVARLRFAGGLDIYYKPRDLSLDLAFGGLLSQLRREGVPDDLRVPAVVARPGYGWVEGVVPRGASDAAEVERYFERGGALLCLAHLLDITDCHSGNVVAAGDCPVLIDLETVCHQRAPDLDERYSDAERRARRTLAESVLGSGLLPDARVEGTLRVELGGLSPGPDAVQHTEQVRWVDIGTDAMRLEPVPLAIGDGAHQLRLHGAMVSLRAHRDALQRGFARMARHAMAHRQAWAAPGGPLQAFADGAARFVFRGTLVYGALRQRLAAPDLAQEAVDRSLLLEVLARPLLDADDAPPVWPLFGAERAALERLDVPHFSTPVGAAVVQIDGGAAPIEGYLPASGLARLRSRLFGFGEADLARELGFIETALVRPMSVATTTYATATADAADSTAAATATAATAATATATAATAAAADAARAASAVSAAAVDRIASAVPAGGAPRVDAGDQPDAGRRDHLPDPVPADRSAPVDTAALRAAAFAVADQLGAAAVWGDDGSATWIEATLDSRHDALTWRSLPPGLGDGVAGLALFLAALERAGAGPHVRRLRLGAQRHLAAGIAQIAAQPIGGLTGAPSVAYALAHVSALTGDRAALALAGDLVDAIPLAAIDADVAFDVAGGVAGTLLCLATVRDIAEAAGQHAVARSAGLRVRACAARLAAASAAAPGGLLPTVGGRVLTGLSHGQAGFALAIARLRGGDQDQDRNRDSDSDSDADADADAKAALQPMARAALAFERAHRDAAAGGWLDLRPDAPTPCACAWCHGAPGIGLVRAALLRAGGRKPDADMIEDLALAARATDAEPDAPLDHLCCGNAGLVNCLQRMAEALDDPALLAGARSRAARVVARAQARGGFTTSVGAPAGFQGLGMFTGLAGVGYSLLCLAEPGLPPLLSFG